MPCHDNINSLEGYFSKFLSEHNEEDLLEEINKARAFRGAGPISKNDFDVRKRLGCELPGSNRTTPFVGTLVQYAAYLVWQPVWDFPK